jgi:phage regulator Rha-like protein
MNEITIFENQNKEVSMTTVEIAERTGKRHDHVLRDAWKMLVELYGENRLPNYGESYINEQNHTYTCYRLPKREVLILVSGYSISLRAAIIDRLNELEKSAMRAVPNFDDPAAAARAWADEFERKQIAEKQRDEAIRTKAQIGSRREATAMNKASQLAKQNEALRKQAGDSKEWKQVKAIPWLSDHFKLSMVAYQQIGRYLTLLSKKNFVEVKEIEDNRYGSVKAYSVEMIAVFKSNLLDDPKLLFKYRK